MKIAFFQRRSSSNKLRRNNRRISWISPNNNAAETQSPLLVQEINAQLEYELAEMKRMREVHKLVIDQNVSVLKMLDQMIAPMLLYKSCLVCDEGGASASKDMKLKKEDGYAPALPLHTETE